jgi:nicotinamide-nucleotide amidase
MLAEIVSIGDELTSGQRLDTNSQWLSQQLAELGIRTGFHTTVADDLEANLRVFQAAVQRADLVIATGGLGPTADDLTREVLARLNGVELVLDQASLDHIRTLFARRERPMPERNTVQALFPRGSRVIPNPHGTAPGVAMTFSRPDGEDVHLFALPGVPKEMEQMWFQTVRDEVRRLSGGGSTLIHHAVRCFGIGESEMEARLGDLIHRGRHPLVGITASGATLTLRITAHAATREEGQALIAPTVSFIHKRLGELVYGEGDEEMEDAVVRLLAARGQSASTAEWGTAGMIADRLGRAAADRTYRGGLVGFSRPNWEVLLGLNVGTLTSLNQEDLVKAMAQSCRSQFQSDWALAVGPFPDEASANPAGLFSAAVASADGVMSQSFTYAAHPDIQRPRGGKHALDLLRRALLRNLGH